MISEVPVELSSGHSPVVAEAVERALPGQQVHERGERQERDDDEVPHGLHREAEPTG